MAFNVANPTVVSIQAVGDILATAGAVSGTTPYSYQWYRSTSSGFSPATANIIGGATALTLNDSGLSQGTTYYYVVVARDSAGTAHQAVTSQLAVTTLTAGTTTSRATQKLFGSSAATNQMSKFGGLFSSYPSIPTRYSGSTITPALVQALSNFLTGWNGAAIGGNSPAIEDMNALCYLFSYQLYYMLQSGIPSWDADTTYALGAVVQDGSGNLYSSKVNNNLNGPLTSTVYWQTLYNLIPAQTITAAMMLNATITGTQVSSNINLAGTAVQAGGQNIVVASANRVAALAIARVTCAADGTITNGEGITIAKTGTGAYTATFSPVFSDVPTVVVSTNTGSTIIMSFNTVSASGCLLQSFVTTTGASNDVAFSVLVIGQR